MIRCVIVEDEEMARKVLKSLLAQYCQDVMVCAEADDITSGQEMIEAFRPERTEHPSTWSHGGPDSHSPSPHARPYR